LDAGQTNGRWMSGSATVPRLIDSISPYVEYVVSLNKVVATDRPPPSRCPHSHALLVGPAIHSCDHAPASVAAVCSSDGRSARPSD
jgi:hypothetical protein